ncbi:MAG TPA: inner membrane-spanning protein YciB [Micropepsaceae bacterium]|jgi:intracellular septation protein|nr:inner membrane-spanning protein YciB [Micropepsaceae bacterium]
MSPRLKMALDYGPLLLFAGVYFTFNLYAATAVLMAAVIVAVATEFAVVRKVSPMLIMTTLFVLPFGGLTLWLTSDIFIKIKPSVLYLTMAAILVGGLFSGRLFIKFLFAQLFQLPDEAWRTLTLRLSAFFIGLAILNLVVWRNFSEGTWVLFKVFGVVALTMIFMLAQTPFIARHQIERDNPPSAS